MASAQRAPAPVPSNGVITAPPKGIVGGNRKKQKRRAKQAAKAAQNAPLPESAEQDADLDYDEDPLGYNDDEDYDFSDGEHQHYPEEYAQNSHVPNGYDLPAPGAKKNRRKKKKGAGHDRYDPDLLGSRLPNLPNAPSVAVQKRSGQSQNIWNTSTQQERQNIKNFWLSLSEDERKSLLKIEKEAVLRKMKQQQKHSCSCTVCGRKRTAIEEELEVLYEGYYEELEQYAHHDHPPLPSTSDLMLPAPLTHAHRPHPLAAPPPPPPPPPHSQHRPSQMMEHLDDEEYSEAEDEYSDDEEYSEEEPEPPRGPVPDFFNFGQNLTVKDNLLTVADDLLKNDGRKFIEMMEQLAERRMQRETEAEYAAQNPSHPGNGYHPNDGYHNDDPNDDFEDDEASYDSQEYEDDELEDEDEMSGLTEEQRMQEGRRMFQIFAARMFEHRVLTAYKEKVASERQQKLLEELQDEEKLEAQREAKKKRDAEKKKDKKKQQQAAKAEEKARKDAEKAAEEQRLRDAELKKQEEARRKKEEQRKKKDEERRKLDEERQKKEAERQRRQLEEQQRREEAERKQRELKAAEKARKDEIRKREKDEREAQEKLARERKTQQDDAERKERDAKTKADVDAHPVVAKRPSHQNMIAIPGALAKQAAVASPKPVVATPAVPKAPTPAKRNSQQGSHASSPKQVQPQASNVTSKSSSPGSAVAPHQMHPPGFPKTILQKPQAPQQTQHLPQMPPPHMQPPPGMSHPQMPNGFGHGPPQGFPQSHMMGGMRSPMPMYPHAGPPGQMPGRMSSFGAPGMPGMHGPPPGMLPHQGRNGFPFENTVNTSAPPGFAAHIPPNATHTSPLGMPINGLPAQEAMRGPLGTHSRQQSVNDKFDATVGRPAPIQRPGSVKAQDEHSDIDDLSRHLGSSALIGDDDEDDHPPLGRRVSQRGGPLDTLSTFGAPVGSFGAPGSAWPTPSSFSQSPGLGHQWGNVGAAGWNTNSFAPNAGFGSMPGPGLHRPSLMHNASRPLTIRIAVCQACKQLSSMLSDTDGGFHNIDLLLRQIDHNRPPLDSLPTLKEIEDICETEGDAQNGGGELSVRKNANGGVSSVRWQPDALTPDLGRQNGHGSLGEIGSPLPAKSAPAIGFGAPGMGRSGAGSISGWAH